MVVYGEYLFIENFITGLLILKLTGKICGLRPAVMRYITGSGLCGLYSFILFVNMSQIEAFALRILFAIFLSGFVFGFKGLLKPMTIFYIASFIMGGISLAIIYFSGFRGVIGTGYIYAEGITYGKVAAGVLAGWCITEIFISMMKGADNERTLQRDIVLRIGETESTLKGYIDTGNHLRDEITGAPVFIISRGAAEKIIESVEKDEMNKRYCIIPFTAAGTKHGVMEGFRADLLTVIAESGGTLKNGENAAEKREQEVRRYSPAIFGIYEGRFRLRGGTSGFDVLLNTEVMERGII